MEGTIVVDGILTSCYASVDHDIAHIGMSPLRWFPGIMRWIFGAENERSPFVTMAKDLKKQMALFH